MKEQNKKIFAIVGMCGSGKTEVVKYLQSKFDWTNVYLPEVLFDEIKRQDLELNWENEECMRIGLRKKHGIGVFAELSLPKIETPWKYAFFVDVTFESYKDYKKASSIMQLMAENFKVLGEYKNARL